MSGCCRLSGGWWESDYSDSTETYSECECGIQTWRPSCACVAVSTPDKCLRATAPNRPKCKPGLIEILIGKTQALYNGIHNFLEGKHCCICENNYAFKKPCKCGVRSWPSSCACEATVAPPGKGYCESVCGCPPPKPDLIQILLCKAKTFCYEARDFIWKKYSCSCPEDEYCWTLFKSIVWFLMGLKIFDDLAKYIENYGRIRKGN